MRIGIKLREDAARICSIIASRGNGSIGFPDDVARDLGIVTRLRGGTRAAWLARRAYCSACVWEPNGNREQNYAAGEAMLRTGWAP